MGDMYSAYSPSSPGGADHRSSDDLSLFLNQILLRSSSSSSHTTSSCSSFVAPLAAHAHSFGFPLTYPHSSSGGSILMKEGIPCLDSGDGVNVGCLSGNVPSMSIGVVSECENETDEGECESEEGLDALVEEVPAKPTPSRSSSKRSRAAEVHNLSEKRRRSRINEKMKALQNLIPNSNKTDKASMLDEAIEYLKQLQLQVQMLSMRNGISLRPMCLPGLLQPVQFSQLSRGVSDENVSQDTNMMGSLPLSQDSAESIIYDLPNQCAVSNQLSVPNMSTVLKSETSYGIKSPIRAHFGPFPLRAASREVGREDGLPHWQLNTDRILPGFEMAKAGVFLPLEHGRKLSPSLNGIQAGRRTLSDEIKLEGQEKCSTHAA